MAIFGCSSFYPATWFVLKETLNKFLHRGNTLRRSRTGLNDSGVYYCYGSKFRGRGQSHGHQYFWAQASLKVYGEFTINTDSLEEYSNIII